MTYSVYAFFPVYQGRWNIIQSTASDWKNLFSFLLALEK